MKRLLVPLLFGLIGTSILIGLGIWQIQRMAVKEAVLAQIDARIAGAPVALPVVADPTRDRYLPVSVAGVFDATELHVLVGAKDLGAGYRVIAPFVTEDRRRILVDRGFIHLEDKENPRTVQAAVVEGNLHWPDEVDGYTPAPDNARSIWFARDVPAMAAALNTEQILIIARRETPDTAEITPLPVDSSNIPNDHLQYVITWFSLAAIWVIMTGFFLWRSRRTTKGEAL
ncbi:SURF1 family protein [Roseovarius aestuarii]|nr:SURF1 family protein [Roseovarius aestuarii]